MSRFSRPFFFIALLLASLSAATATAANLRSMESLWRLGVAAECVLLIATVALTLILYVMLMSRPCE